MKKILAATDFSHAAAGAVEYAASMARVFNASLVLLHTVGLPLMPPDAGVVMVEPALKLIQEQEAALKDVITQLGQRYTLSIEGYVKEGPGPETIVDAAAEMQADLIVMGMKGTGKTSQLFGNTVTGVMRRSKLPVLAVPEGYVYKPVDNINFAADYGAVANETCYDILHEIAGKYKSFVRLAHVQKNDEMSAAEVDGKMKLNLVMEGIQHDFFTVTHHDVEEGLQQFNESHETAMLVMVAHRHNFFKRLFGEIHTRNMSYLSKVPLLALQDKEPL